MNVKNFIVSLYLFCCSSVVFADVQFNKIEQEMLFSHSGAQRISDKEEKDQYLKLDKDGIKVYIYRSKNSNVGTFKAVSQINASLDSILAVMMNNTSCSEWIHACEKSLLLEDISFNERYHYQICDIPFPFKNRDFIFHSIMKQDPKTKVVTITVSSVPEYCDDNQSVSCSEVNQSKLVRVRKSIGAYKLEPNERGTKITWIQHTEPGGNLPDWLVNQFVKHTPYQSLKKLAQKVTEKKYKYARLIYSAEGIAIAINTPVSKQQSVIAENFAVSSTF